LYLDDRRAVLPGTTTKYLSRDGRIWLRVFYSRKLALFFHDPFEIDLVADGEAVFVTFFEAILLVEADGAFVFAEDAEVDFEGLGE